MRIEAHWKDNPAASLVHDRLSKRGYRFLLVGGAVRNALLGLPSGDLDVATDARPEVVESIFRQTRAKVVTHGIEHGMLMVVVEGLPLEITTFRMDVETDGRHARVAHSTDIVADAKRRDFTMNAIYAEFDGTVVDPLDGMEDLRARRVRFVGNARDRIIEDHLRTLRYFRFHAHYGDQARGMDAEALAAISDHAGGIGIISKERITDELAKLLLAPSPTQALSGMSETKLLDRVLPGARIDLFPKLEQLEMEFRVSPDPLRRLAALGGDAGRLRLDRRSAIGLRKLSAASNSDRSAEELGYRVGAETGLSAALLRAARSGLMPSDDLVSQVKHGASRTFPVKAGHLPAGIEGQRIGQTLRQLERTWIDTGFKATTRELLALVQLRQDCDLKADNDADSQFRPDLARKSVGDTAVNMPSPELVE